MNISTNICEDDILYGGGSVRVNYSVYNPYYSVYNIEGEIKIPCYLCDVSLDLDESSRGYNFDQNFNRITYRCDLNKNKYANCSYVAKISCNALDTLGEPPANIKIHSLNSTTLNTLRWRWDYQGKHGKLNIKNCSNITIGNKQPELDASSANIAIEESMLYTQPQPQKQDTLIAIKTKKPFNVTLHVNSSDRENENLTYIWRYEDVTDESEGNNPLNNNMKVLCKKNESNCIISLDELELERKYSFYVSAKDPREGVSEEIQVKIKHNGYNYSYIYQPSSHPTIPILFYIVIILILFIVGIKKESLYRISRRNKQRPKDKKKSGYIDEAILILIILLITCVYIMIYFYGYEYISPFYKSTELWVYLQSLSLFEIYVYLVVFVVVVYFTEACFGQEEMSKKPTTLSFSSIEDSIKLVTVSRLWIINSIFMLVILLSLDAIILEADRLNTQEWLINYYGEMGEIFATILAIIAAFYTAIPKNVISTRWSRGGKEKKPFSYVHTKILQYFLVLYGVIVALSIWGFSVGVTVDFPPLVQLNRANFFNLVSIGVFETTLLLVPPAITCLYELLRSILFTGNIKLESKPAGAKIFVDERDTNLVTPNQLMLPSGSYKISLRKDGYRDYDELGERGEINISAGTEQEFYCELIQLIHLDLE